MTDNNNEDIKIVLVDDEGNEHLFVEYDRISYEGEEYAFLIPEDTNEPETAHVFKIEEKDGELVYNVVEDTNLLDKVEEAWHNELTEED
ncbi:DUF1292 domain-containing protein [Proteinivorax hydrogeniformans]|uniref:DUF1292 domain-containing protein n=1 Tax=Proteinivorax hydrogeniformans TaxID=1826727 RepID=A0AAU8HR06_9FIRM